MTTCDTHALGALAWPASRLDEATRLLAREAGLDTGLAQPRAAATTRLALATSDDARVEAAARALGLDAEPVFVSGSELRAALDRVGPAVLRLPVSEGARHLVVVHAYRGRAELLAPDRAGRVEVELDTLADALLGPDAALRADVDGLLATLGARAHDDAARLRLERALVRERLGSRRVELGILLRPAAGAALVAHLGRGGLFARAAALLAAHFGAYALGLFAWFSIGAATFAGRVDRGLLFGWALLLISQLPLAALAQHLGAQLSVDVGALLKRRLFAGALAQDAEAVRAQGVGTLLGKVLEAEAVEGLALGGSLAGVLALVELAACVWVLAHGASAWLLAPGLLFCVLAALALCARYGQRRLAWSDARRAASAGLIERMVGHRTRLVQQRREHFHRDEDTESASTFETGVRMDGAYLALASLPRAWMVGALAVVCVGFATADDGAGSAALAIALGGAMLGSSALSRLVSALPALAAAFVALRSAAELYRGARDGAAASGARETLTAPEPGQPLVEAKGLELRHAGRAKPVLGDCSLQIRDGERMLLEGASGGGKSSLASLLSGLREPDAGLLLYRGLDRHVLGNAAIASHVATAPQFHDNHVLSGPLAFNLLMGRAWPPLPDDLARAEQLCRSLGLGPLLDRMPAGIMQMVGETGWQLSHGEKSRLFMARALLQDADLTILDESLSALDPVTAREALRTAHASTRALMLIAHP